MHHLSCLSVDKDYKNFYFYMDECDENMTKSYHASFLTFWLYYKLTPLDFLKVKWLNSHIFYELCGCKGLGEV